MLRHIYTFRIDCPFENRNAAPDICFHVFGRVSGPAAQRTSGPADHMPMPQSMPAHRAHHKFSQRSFTSSSVGKLTKGPIDEGVPGGGGGRGPNKQTTVGQCLRWWFQFSNPSSHVLCLLLLISCACAAASAVSSFKSSYGVKSISDELSPGRSVNYSCPGVRAGVISVIDKRTKLYPSL